jgi:hypothetical protein
VQRAAASGAASPPAPGAPARVHPLQLTPAGGPAFELPTVVRGDTSPAGGTEPPTGHGGATWQLRIAPRHRAVVQRFFAAGDTTPGERR